MQAAVAYAQKSARKKEYNARARVRRKTRSCSSIAPIHRGHLRVMRGTGKNVYIDMPSGAERVGLHFSQRWSPLRALVPRVQIRTGPRLRAYTEDIGSADMLLSSRCCG